MLHHDCLPGQVVITLTTGLSLCLAGCGAATSPPPAPAGDAGAPKADQKPAPRDRTPPPF